MTTGPGGSTRSTARDPKWTPPKKPDSSPTGDESGVDRFAPPGDGEPPAQRRPVAEVRDQPAARSGSVSGRRALLWGAVVVTVCFAATAMYLLGSATGDSEPPVAATDLAADGPSNDPATASISPTAEAELRVAASASGLVGAVAVIETPDGVVGVTLPLEANVVDQVPGAVQMWTLDDDEWTEAAVLEVPATVFAWTVIDVTDDGTDDLVLEGTTGNATVGMVVSVADGDGRLISFDVGGDAYAMTGPLRFEPEGLTTSENTCVPSCAEGAVIDLTWHYDAANDRFVR